MTCAVCSVHDGAIHEKTSTKAVYSWTVDPSAEPHHRPMILDPNREPFVIVTSNRKYFSLTGFIMFSHLKENSWIAQSYGRMCFWHWFRTVAQSLTASVFCLLCLLCKSSFAIRFSACMRLVLVVEGLLLSWCFLVYRYRCLRLCLCNRLNTCMA